LYKILSTFTGAGGLDIGFHGDFQYLGKEYKKLDFHTKVALDINSDACKTLENNHKYFKETKVLNENILEYDYHNIPNDHYDVLLGGFPCVTFSIVGKQSGVKDDINGKLYESYAHYVEHFKPKVFLAENVKGILSANKGEAIKIIKKRFEDTGYNLKIFLVNFADFSVPQLRERVLFIGIRNDIKTEFVSPEFTTKEIDRITVKDAFHKIDTSCENHVFMKQTAKTKEKLEAIPEGGNFKDLPEHLAVKGLMSNIYRKLDRNKPSYTIIASGGGGTWTYHYSEPRAITNRERARIQSFPDDFKFKGSNTEIRRQIGNAVPAVGIYHFAERIQNVLDGITPPRTNNCIKEYDVNTRKFIN
jgi:DNA (cytosine-5)-methyltransferase 1